MHLIIFASPLHDAESVMACRKSLFDDLLREEFCRRYGLPYDGTLTMHDCAETTLPQEDVVCFIGTGGTEEMFRATLDRLPDGELVLLSDAYHNSFAASFEIASYLDARGRSARMVNIPLQDDGGTTYDAAQAGDGGNRDAGEHARRPAEAFYTPELLKALSGRKIGLIGGPSSWLIASDVDKDYVSGRFGVQFVEIGIDELIAEFNALGGAKTGSAQAAQNDEERRVAEAETMQQALENIVARYSLDALTLKCFDLLEPCRTTSCLALARLNDKGIVCGCEGDLPALWTMMAVHALTGRAPFMANPASSDKRHASVDFAHCTIPLSMTQRYSLPTHFESGIGVGIAGIVPLGEYEIVKIGGPQLDRIFRTRGRVVLNTHVPARCRTQVSFVFDSPADFDAFMGNRLGNHVILYPLF